MIFDEQVRTCRVMLYILFEYRILISTVHSMICMIHTRRVRGLKKKYIKNVEKKFYVRGRN